MSYFDDNEDRIIYGPQRRYAGPAKSSPPAAPGSPLARRRTVRLIPSGKAES